MANLVSSTRIIGDYSVIQVIYLNDMTDSEWEASFSGTGEDWIRAAVSRRAAPVILNVTDGAKPNAKQRAFSAKFAVDKHLQHASTFGLQYTGYLITTSISLKIVMNVMESLISMDYFKHTSVFPGSIHKIAADLGLGLHDLRGIVEEFVRLQDSAGAETKSVRVMQEAILTLAA